MDKDRSRSRLEQPYGGPLTDLGAPGDLRDRLAAPGDLRGRLAAPGPFVVHYEAVVTELAAGAMA